MASRPALRDFDNPDLLLSILLDEELRSCLFCRVAPALIPRGNSPRAAPGRLPRRPAMKIGTSTRSLPNSVSTSRRIVPASSGAVARKRRASAVLSPASRRTSCQSPSLFSASSSPGGEGEPDPHRPERNAGGVGDADGQRRLAADRALPLYLPAHLNRRRERHRSHCKRLLPPPTRIPEKRVFWSSAGKRRVRSVNI